MGQGPDVASIDSLTDKVVRRGAQLFGDALAELRYELDRVVPDSGSVNESGEKLRASRVITERPFDGRVFSASIAYTAPQAEYTERGTEPHVIEPGRPPDALRFYWPKVGDVVFLARVIHPGSHKHDGWFSSTMTEWPDLLERVAQR
jgi:hypothetical protein